MSQLDEPGFGNMMKASLKDKKVTSKNLPFGLNSMPADFINAYVIGSMGKTGGVNGACATFLYNLEKATQDIKSGEIKVAIVGNSEAPITQEIIDGYAAMNALATDKKLRSMLGEVVDYTKVSRPFGKNCGFVLGESSQFIILMSEDLAIRLRANIHGSVPHVFICSDGFKHSISGPGPGNYVTLAKAVKAAFNLVGEKSVTDNSFVHAHGSSTPQNRVTESEILDKTARAMGIKNWPVTAVKAFVGHSLSPASGEQLISALGTFKYDIIPGIKTIEENAEDVSKECTNYLKSDTEGRYELSFINSKGFGGNNATCLVLSPRKTLELLSTRYTAKAIEEYNREKQQTEINAQEYFVSANNGYVSARYSATQSQVRNEDIQVTKDKICFSGMYKDISL